MLLKKRIAYVYDWKLMLGISGGLGLLVVGILIFLQPFDTYLHQVPYKDLRLAGYFFPVALSISLLHFAENWAYCRMGRVWRVWCELLSMLVLFGFTTVLTYLYMSYVVNQEPASLQVYLVYTRYFAFPFMLLLWPLLIYLRLKFGELWVPIPAGETVASPMLIKGDNKEEFLSLDFNDFLYAQSTQNYVDIYFLNQERQLEKSTLRLTLSRLLEQLPKAHQIHRSYILNPSFVKSLEGNARKRFVCLEYKEEPLPLSQKYYEKLQVQLSISSQNFENSPK